MRRARDNEGASCGMWASSEQPVLSISWWLARISAAALDGNPWMHRDSCRGIWRWFHLIFCVLSHFMFAAEGGVMGREGTSYICGCLHSSWINTEKYSHKNSRPVDDYNTFFLICWCSTWYLLEMRAIYLLLLNLLSPHFMGLSHSKHSYLHGNMHWLGWQREVCCNWM